MIFKIKGKYLVSTETFMGSMCDYDEQIVSEDKEGIVDLFYSYLYRAVVKDIMWVSMEERREITKKYDLVEFEIDMEDKEIEFVIDWLSHMNRGSFKQLNNLRDIGLDEDDDYYNIFRFYMELKDQYYKEELK